MDSEELTNGIKTEKGKIPPNNDDPINYNRKKVKG